MTDDGDLGALRRLADGGNEQAADRLAERAAASRDVEALQRLADEGSEVAARHLSRIIAETG